MEEIDLNKLNIQSLEDLLEKEYMLKFCEDFGKSTGIEVALVGIRNPMEFKDYPTKFQFCQNLKQEKEFADGCSKGMISAMKELEQTEDDIIVSSCHIGLLKFGCWIKVAGKKLGILAGCKVAPKKSIISKNKCKKICKKFKYQDNYKKMYQYFKQFPVFSKKNLIKTLNFFKIISQNISEIAKTKYFLKLEDLKKSNILKYFSPDVYNRIEKQNNQQSIKYEAVILFVDIRNYVTKCDKLSPEELVMLLNEYFEFMVDIIFEYHGSLDKFIGDAILAVFGTTYIQNKENNAVRAAFKMVREVNIFNNKRLLEGKDPIDIGIGIHTGEIIAGNIGSTKLVQYTVIGDTVNVASRLESISKNYPEKIIISEQVYDKVKDIALIAKEEYVQLKGKNEMTKIYRVSDINVSEYKYAVL